MSSSLDKQMIKYINIARQQPNYFIPLLQKQIKSFVNDKQMPLTQQVIYQTNQGKCAWQETLKFLLVQKPIPGLQQHDGLHMSANSHAKDLAKNNIFGHTGSDGSSFSQRILRYCRKGHGSMAQLIGADFNFNNRNHAEMTVLGLLIDDGVLDKGHRKTIFNPSYQYIGCRSEIQGEKVITVFNMTENKLSIRGQPNSQSATTGFGHNRNNSTNFKSPSKVFENNKSGFDQGRFNQTDFNLKKPTQNGIDNSKSFFQNNSTLTPNLNINKFTSPEKKINPFSRTTSEVPKNTGNRKICQKKQTSKVYYEQGAKVTEIVTQLIYNDGTIEEKTDKHTIYL